MPDEKVSNVIQLSERRKTAQRQQRQQLQLQQEEDDELAFFDWLGGDAVLQITVLIRITESSWYDCGHATRKIASNVVELGGYEIHAKGDGLSFGNVQPMELFFSTDSREQADEAMALFAVGNILVVTGDHCLLLDDEPPSFTVYITALEEVRPVPAHFLSVAAWWLASTSLSLKPRNP